MGIGALANVQYRVRGAFLPQKKLKISFRIRNGPNYKKFVVTDLKNASYMSLDMDEKPPDKTNPPIM
jgi:hypothetical protein